MPTVSLPQPDLDDGEIERIALGLLDCSLPPAEWTHGAHFASALWLLRHRPESAEPEAMRTTISRYNVACGKVNSATEGYHHSITIASLRAAKFHLERDGEGTLADVLSRLMASAQGQSGWLLAHWSPEVLFTPEARGRWVPPDREPLPF